MSQVQFTPIDDPDDPYAGPTPIETLGARRTVDELVVTAEKAARCAEQDQVPMRQWRAYLRAVCRGMWSTAAEPCALVSLRQDGSA